MTYSVQTYEASKFYKKIGTKFLFYPYFYVLLNEILNAFKNEQDVAKTTTNNLGGYHNEKF